MSDDEWERETLERARQAAADLIDAALELRWYTPDPLGAALGHLEAVLRQRGLLTAEGETVDAPRKRKPLPFRQVWDRDNWTCRHCGSHTALTVDHIVPWSKGGSDDLDNLQTLCSPCNRRKGDR